MEAKSSSSAFRSTSKSWDRRLLNPHAVTNLWVAALGLLLVGAGLGKWATVAWLEDTGGAGSPLPYGTRVNLPAKLAELSDPWRVIVAAEPSQEACSDTYHQISSEEVLHAAALILNPQLSHVTYLCMDTANMAAPNDKGVPLTVVSGRPSLSFPTGFVVLDSFGRVVYGSRRFKDLKNLEAVYALLQARQLGSP